MSGGGEQLTREVGGGHVDLRPRSERGGSGRLWAKAIAGVRAGSTSVKAEEAKILEYLRRRVYHDAGMEAESDEKAFARGLDDPRHPFNFGDQDDPRTRYARNEEERGRAILAMFGTNSELFSEKGDGAHSFSAFGVRYWAKDPSDRRFKPVGYGAPGPWPFETGSESGRPVRPRGGYVLPPYGEVEGWR
jgi:hypothetical protein